MIDSTASIEIYNLSKDIIGWEQLGIAAVRVGNWKAVFLPPPRGPGEWELYDISRDQGEIHDLAEARPEKLAEMIIHYETYFQESGLFDSYELFQSAARKAGVKRIW
jgi:arylsulfatase